MRYTLSFVYQPPIIRALSDARVIKTDSEIKMMRVAITVSAYAIDEYLTH